ncbi:MAG: hypothetical protein QM500_21435 [Methylococcales bacterium]
MNPLGWLFGGSDAAGKTVDNISSGIDKMFYTDEEKADARKQGFELFIEWQKATQPQNLARRLIALIITVLYSVLIIAGITAWYFNPDYAVFIFNMLTELILQPFNIIIIFYYGKGMVSDFTKARSN